MAFVNAFSISKPTAEPPNVTSSRSKWSVRMGPWKPGEKDEAYRLQQEILARRRDQKKSKEYFELVEKRRAELEEYRKERQLVVPEGEDPIIAWQKLKEKGLIPPAGYPEEEPGGDAEGGIPLPMASFGIPKYDQGGRFDMRLPHVCINCTILTFLLLVARTLIKYFLPTIANIHWF